MKVQRGVKSRTKASAQVQYGQIIEDRLHRAFDLAMQRGHDPEDLPAMIESALDTYQPPGQADAVYDELPEGLIDLPAAAERYGVNRQTIHTWIRTGRLQSKGRLRASARGGGFHLLLESDVRDCAASPRSKGGRPKLTQ